MSDLIIINGKSLPTLIALTEPEQEIGLMYKEWPPPIMTFPFINSEIRKFWMKNTPSPLDIIFCNSGRIVGIYEGKPYSEDLIGPNSPVNLVVETPAGMAKKLSINSGDNVKLKYSLESLAKKFAIILE